MRRSVPPARAVEKARRSEPAFSRLLPSDRGQLYFDLGRIVMKPAVRLLLEELMANQGAYRYQSDFAKRYFAQGEAKGREEGREEGRELALFALSALLRSRFGPLPEEALRRLDAADAPTLRRWTASVEDAPSLKALLDLDG